MQIKIERPRKDAAQLNATVQSVLDDVRLRGDAAVKEYEQKFDRVALTSLKVTEAEMLATGTSQHTDIP